jgi:hypothetical protein
MSKSLEKENPTDALAEAISRDLEAHSLNVLPNDFDQKKTMWRTWNRQYP